MQDRIQSIASEVTGRVIRPSTDIERKFGGQVYGRIDRVGFVVNGRPDSWAFDCRNDMMTPAINILETADILYAGYSVAQLREISRIFWEEK